MNRKSTLVSAVIVGVVVLGGLVWMRQSREEPFPAAQAQSPAPVLAVQATTPERRSVSRLITLPGDVHPLEEATLYAKVPGYLERITVDKGDRVKAGQLLAVIQAPELAADRDQARQSYQSVLAAAQGSRAAQERAAAERQRALITVEKAQADYAQAPAGLEKTKWQLAQMQSALNQAQAQKRQTEAGLEESRAQAQKAEADLEAAKADQQLADVTFARYDAIYKKDHRLIARQDVDVMESKAKAARNRMAAAQSQVEAMLRHITVAQAQVSAAASQVEQAQAQVAASKEQVHIAEAQQTALRKQMELAVGDVAISKREQEVSQAKTQEARAQANAGRSAFGKLAAIADYARIRAPFNGVVIKRYVDPGAFIQTAATSQNAAPIVTLADLRAVRLDVNVPETEARFVRRGTPVFVTTSGLPDLTLKGKVTRTSGALDAKNRTLLVESELPNTDGKLLPGSYATTKVVLETHSNVLSLPTAAVGVEKTGKFVFVVENGRAKRISVTTGFDDGAYIEIADGLHGGETVVVTGRDALTPGATVKATRWTPLLKK